MFLPDTAHRPWPLPRRPWLLAMQWHDLLFMHWPVAPGVLRPLLPPTVALDTWDGSAWLGITPLRMAGVRPRWLPPLPWLSAFPELNVRTYVTAQGKPGVWFLSLDAGNPLAVRGARAVFHLPYYDATMTVEWEGSAVRYRSKRTHRGAPSAAFIGRYQPCGPVAYAAVGSLAYWLTERYCLYASDRHGQLWRGDIHHARWPLQPAEADIVQNTLAEPLRLRLPADAPLLHFARRLDVVGWMLEAVETSS
ncbi:MAG: YqjF family protein [Candidatus Tectimicrobiota bacterium]